jgi:hypothetical protein
VSKRAKKKRVRDRLAKKKAKKKTKKKVPPPTSKKKTDSNMLNNMLMSTVPLLELEVLRDITFDQEKLTTYLQKAQTAPEQQPIDFLRNGIKTVITDEVLDNIRNRFSGLLAKKDEPEHILLSVNAYFKLIDMGITPEYIPLFLFLFAKQVKHHPLSDDAKIWKYIIDFVPKKVVAPDEQSTIIVPGKQKPEEKKEKEEDKRDEKYPHIILPR